MRSYSLLLCLGSVAVLAAQAARADVPVSCPDGQAVHSIGAGGKSPTCIPVPAPVDLGGVNAAIAAEAAARLAGDTGEAMARMQADQEIRDSMSEADLSGRYAVVGIANCLRSTAGFNAAQLSPTVAPGSSVQPQSFTYTGTRTIDGNVMHGTSLVYSLVYPSTFFQSPTSFNGGGGSVVQVSQDHNLETGADHTLTITGLGSHGVFLAGSSSLVGGTVETVGAPSLTGKISKDGRTIVLTNAEMTVETTTTTPLNGTPSSLQRMCTRMETMYKLAD